MRRRLFGSILAAVALASTAAIPILASPAGAALACPLAGSFPNVQGAQANLKVDCTTAAGDNAGKLTIHDSVNAHWHSGAARQVTITTEAINSATIVASGFTASDVRRPISGFNSVAGACFQKPLFQGGTFVTAVAGTTITLSRNTPASCTQSGGKALVEQTNNRVLVDASCTAGVTSTLTSTSAKFVATDINKSVTGGPFKLGAKITAVPTATTATVTSTAANAVCTAPDTITLGAQTCAAGAGCTPGVSLDPDTRQLSNHVGPPVVTAFTCAGSTLTVPAAGGGFKATNSDVGLTLVMTGSGAAVTKTITANTTGSATFTPAGCAVGQTATVGTAVIGVPNANAPKNASAMMTLAAELNLNPTLVSTQDDCGLNTFEGFEVLGQWQNPGSYVTAGVIGAGTVSPAVTTAQVLFPTSVISFQGFVGPAIADVVLPGVHANFSFPSLPTSLAVCLTAGAPANATALSFGIIPTPLASAPFLPTGSGNPGAPGVRSLDSRTGATNLLKIEVKTAAGVNLGGSPATPPGCSVNANTAIPTFALTTCGDG